MSTPIEQFNRPDYKCDAWSRQQEALTLVRDLAGGTRAMRAAGVKYLPKEKGERDDSYKIRKDRSLLFNTFNKTRGGLVGMALKDDPVFTVPPRIKPLLDDIDLAGNAVNVFLKDVFLDVITEGHCHIFVDMDTPLPERASYAQQLSRRPYWLKRKKDEAINWSADKIDGEYVLTHITFREECVEKQGRFGQKTVIYYRVLELPVINEDREGRKSYGPMRWELYRERDKAEPEIVTENTTTLDRIPVVTIYGRQTGFMESQPPLEDLAHLNVGHWQQWSDINNQLRFLVPILCRRQKEKPLQDPDAQANAKKPEQLGLGPSAIADLYGEGTDIFYRSHDGTAIGAAREALIDLERRMSAVGLSIITEKSDAETTATKDLLDAGERVSELMTWVRALEDGTNTALYFTAKHLGMEDGGTVEIRVSAVDEEAVKAVPGTLPGKPQQEQPEMVQ